MNEIKGYCHCCGAPNIDDKYDHDKECIYYQPKSEDDEEEEDDE